MRYNFEKSIRIKFIPSGSTKRSTITYINSLPDNFWDEVVEPFIKGEKTFGKAKKVLTISVIIPQTSGKEAGKGGENKNE